MRKCDSKINNRVHKLFRLVTKGFGQTPRIVYQCWGCGYQRPADAIIGCETHCWLCNAVFNIDGYAAGLKKPVCVECRVHRSGIKGRPTNAERIEKAQPRLEPVTIDLEAIIQAMKKSGVKVDNPYNDKSNEA